MLPAPNTFELAPNIISKNSKNTLYSGNENSELKIMHFGKLDPEDIFVFRI